MTTNCSNISPAVRELDVVDVELNSGDVFCTLILTLLSFATFI